MSVPDRLNVLPGILIMNIRPFDEPNICRGDRMNFVRVGSIAQKKDVHPMPWETIWVQR